jgi:4-diphosphocytidyl-2-C-methyl-D-erythritol kinase
VRKITLHSYAKLNLYLQVLSKRRDNYHNLRTLFERINLFDTIILKNRRDSQLRIISSSADIPQDASNLCLKAALLLQKDLSLAKGADISIIKRIPVASGMGGGSSNAAATLSGLNRLWGLGLSQAKLLSYAAKIGADVPFFVQRCRFALAGQRGDQVQPLRNLKRVKLWHLLAVPRIKVSTRCIYQKWDELKKRKKVGLTLPKYNVNILTLALEKKELALVRIALFNNLEEITLRLYPCLKEAREILRKQGLKSILMSGSGPTLFTILPSRKESLFLVKQLKKKNKSLRFFSVCSI